MDRLLNDPIGLAILDYVKTGTNKDIIVKSDLCDAYGCWNSKKYEDEAGGLWIDLNTEYHGNFKFQMKYGKHSLKWFNWLYVDHENFKAIAEKVGLSITKLAEQDNQYLVELRLN